MRPNKFLLFLMLIAGMSVSTLTFPSWCQTLPAVMAAPAIEELVDAPDAKAITSDSKSDPNEQKATGAITGTVTDTYGDIVPGATVVVQASTPAERRVQIADDNAYFHFDGLKSGLAYNVTITAQGFDPWVAPPVVLGQGQFFELSAIKLKLENAVTSVTVTSSPIDIATEQVQIEEKQRILGFVPNFYVVYDSQNAVPLTTKLKFQMAYKVSVDPVTIVGALALAGMNQAGDRPNYQQGWLGYGQRVGAAYADGVTDVMFGGAILPWLFKQDPRYYYQGTGTVKSRMRHALANPFFCRGDNGKTQVNYSSLGGDLISNALSNAYYPDSNRGAGLFFSGFVISTGTREVSSILQEFVIKKLTPSTKRR